MTTISQEEDRAFTQLAIEWLERRGYTVTRGIVYRTFITCKQFSMMLPISLGKNGMSRRLKHPNCPAFDAELGPTGRIMKVLPNPALIAFCSQPMTHTRMLTVDELHDFHHDNGS
jgi:hypothetical protein